MTPLRQTKIFIMVISRNQI